MQESSGTLLEKFSVLMCCKGLVLHRERSPSDRRLDTCTGSPKGARLVPREIDLLEKKITPFFYPSSPHKPSFTPPNFCGKEKGGKKQHLDELLSSSLETNDLLVSLRLGPESGEEF